ncbi:MAG: SH3 domain-containing protein [Spirochaetales bacterium]
MKLRLFAALALSGSLLFSCGFGRQATGVVLWAPEPAEIGAVAAVKNADVVWIWEQSRIRRSFKIQESDGSASLETDQWRIRSFANENEARDFAKNYAALKDAWAVSGKQGLPVRETPDANANRVYKLGENEEVKVLSKQDKRVKQGNLEGTWVEILTKDGYSGWVFDYYLSLVDKAGGTAVKASGAGDEKVQLILSTSWYPEEMKVMVDQDRLQPEVFRPELGLRLVSAGNGAGGADGSARSFLLTLASEAGPDELYELPWEEPRKIDDLSYWFGGPEKLRVQFTNPELTRITLGFTWKGQEKNIPLSVLPGDVGTLLSRELASRQQKWVELLNHGSVLSSPTYGVLTLGENGAFTWAGFETLQPPSGDILPANLPPDGRIVFDWFNDRKLVGEFRAVRFEFGQTENGNTPAGPSQVFLYRFLKDGLQLLPVLPRDTDQAKHTVLRESKSGLSIFFTFQQ